MRNSLICALALASAGLLAEPAEAQYSDASLHAGALEVPVNKSQVVSADRAIGKAMIGNPEIADIVPITTRSVYVLGKKMGTTSLTLYDGANRVLAIMDVDVGPDVEALRRQISQLVPNQQIDARISSDSVVLSGMVSDPGAADRATQIAKAYSDKVINLISVGSSQQVMLEVRFAEVNRQIGEKLEVSGFGLSRGGSFDSVIGSTASLVPGPNGVGVPQLSAITDAYGIFRKTFSIGNVDIEGILDSLERRGLSKTLAEPTLIALSGEKASFLAGGEFPVPVIQSGTNGGAGNAITVEFKPFGVGLGFTPTVLGDKIISMVIEPEVSSIDPSASITINGLVVPGLQTRRASTTVQLRDGESFAIAGLLRRDFQTTVRQLPLLGSIPIIGTLFRSSNFQKGETELMIVVTPRLVAPLRPEQVRLPTDRIEDPKASDVMIDGEGYRPKQLPPAPSRDGAPAPSTQAAPPQSSSDAKTPPAPAASTPSRTEQGYAY